MKVAISRLFENENDFVCELKKMIAHSGVRVRQNFYWPILQNGILIDLVVPGPCSSNPILFAIECKAYQNQQALQNALGKCMIAHQISPGRASVCLCIPTDDPLWQHTGFDLLELLKAYKITMLNEKTIVEHIHNTKLNAAFDSLPLPHKPKSEWAGAEAWRKASPNYPPIQRPMEVLVTDQKLVRKATREKEREARREANETLREEWRRVWSAANG